MRAALAAEAKVAPKAVEKVMRKAEAVLVAMARVTVPRVVVRRTALAAATVKGAGKSVDTPQSQARGSGGHDS